MNLITGMKSGAFQAKEKKNYYQLSPLKNDLTLFFTEQLNVQLLVISINVTVRQSPSAASHRV